MTRHMGITEFKTHLLRLADEVAANGETIVVTRHGRPLLRVESAAPPRSMAGTGRMLVSREEFMAPFDDEWDALR